MTDATIANIERRTGRDGEAALVAMTRAGPADRAGGGGVRRARSSPPAEAGAINGQSLIIDGGGVQQ